MARPIRTPACRGIILADLEKQLTSGVFRQEIRSAGLMALFGTVRSSLGNAMTESFWSTMQIEFLNPKKWASRIELANVIFRYTKVVYSCCWHLLLDDAPRKDYVRATTPQALTTTRR